MNSNSEPTIPISHRELSTETNRIFSSNHSRLIEYTSQLPHSSGLNEGEEDINYGKTKHMEVDLDGGEEVIEDGQVDELDERFSYNRQLVTADSFSLNRNVTDVNRSSQVENSLSLANNLSGSKAPPTTNTTNLSWQMHDNSIGGQFKSIPGTANIKQEASINSFSEPAITSRSFTFPSNSPPDIVSSNNFRGGRSSSNAKNNNNSWLATQPKLNAKSKSGYILFSAEVRKRVMNENPLAGFGEVSKIVGIEWKRLSDEDKRDYESRVQFIAAERAKAELLTPNSKLPQPGQIRIYCCRWQQCDFQFDTQDGLYEHIRTSHTSKLDNDTQFACLWNSCLKYRKEGKPFPSLPRLNRHLKEKHLASAMRLVFPNQRAKNFFVYTPVKQEISSFPSTSNGGSHHYTKGGHNNLNETHGHFVHYPYGDVPANPVACEVATPLSFGTDNNALSHLGSIKRRGNGGQHQSHNVTGTSIQNMAVTSSTVSTPRAGSTSALLNGALLSPSVNSTYNNSGTSTYNYSIQQQSQNQRNQQTSNQQQNITQQTVYIPPGQQAIIVNGVTVYIPSNAQTIILPPGYTGPQQQHQIVVHTQTTQQHYTQQITQPASSTQSYSNTNVTSIQQKYLHSAAPHSTVPSHSSSNTPAFQQHSQGLSSTPPPIQSQSSSGSAVQNVTTNVIQSYQSPQHYTHYDQSPASSVNQHRLADTSSTSLAFTSEIQNTDPGRSIISTTSKQQALSEPSFVCPSTSVQVRRVVHSEAYIRYLESIHNSGAGRHQRNVSKWDKTLTASARNTVVPEHKRLPYEWIRHSSNGSSYKEDEIVRALWKLREYLVEDTTGIKRSQGNTYEAEAPEPPGYTLLSTIGKTIEGAKNLNFDKKKC
uniref:HMG box domain-containing protein n=1 Tax=Meloidogyne incognita TaxID=6306 RepID=A0A914L9F7_MELIC